MSRNLFLDLVPGLGEKTVVPLYDKDKYSLAGLTIGARRRDGTGTGEITADGRAGARLVQIEHKGETSYYLIAVCEVQGSSKPTVQEKHA